MIVKYSPSFIRIFKKIDVRIRKSFKQRILVFSKNPSEPQPNNHSLKDEYEGYSSIDITSDWRAIYKETQIGEDAVAYFVELGIHEKLYKINPPKFPQAD